MIFRLLLASAAALAVAGPAAAQASRQILQRQDIAGTQKEAVIGTATLPAGHAIGRHTHPGEEVGYVLKGPLLLKVDGRPDRVLAAGQSYAVPRGVVHDAMAHGEGEAQVTAVWIVDKGAPMSSPAN